MKFLYGYDNQHYTDITDIVFKKCLKDDELYIPRNDNVRCKLFEMDPYPNVLKHIVIIDHLQNSHIFTDTMEISIKFMSISKQLSFMKHPKMWFNAIGKLITNTDDKLNEIHKHIKFSGGDIKDELVEQTMTLKYLPRNAKVLEIGGNIGRNTSLISMILDDERNLVTLESHPEIAKMLIANIQMNDFKTHIEAAALSKRRLIQRGWDTMVLDNEANIPHGWNEIKTITFDELNSKYNIEFDTLVADCEGALYQILKDEPKLLDNMKLLIVENDYYDINQRLFVEEQFKNHGFKRVWYTSGGFQPCYDFFWEVWKKE